MNFNPSQIKRGKIQDVIVRDLVVNVDDRGILSEVCRTDFPEISRYNVKFNQVYVVRNTAESVRAFHKHEHLIDYFTIVHGEAKFILVDDRPESPCFGTMQIINVSELRYRMITVPTGVFHGWKGSYNTILVSVANELYMGQDRKGVLDEERIPWDIFGSDIWNTENK